MPAWAASGCLTANGAREVLLFLRGTARMVQVRARHVGVDQHRDDEAAEGRLRQRLGEDEVGRDGLEREHQLAQQPLAPGAEPFDLLGVEEQLAAAVRIGSTDAVGVTGYTVYDPVAIGAVADHQHAAARGFERVEAGEVKEVLIRGRSVSGKLADDTSARVFEAASGREVARYPRHGATENTRCCSPRSRAAGVTIARSVTTSLRPA